MSKAVEKEKMKTEGNSCRVSAAGHKEKMQRLCVLCHISVTGTIPRAIQVFSLSPAQIALLSKC